MFIKKVKSIFFLCIFLLVLFAQNNLQILNAIPMLNNQDKFITEELRIKVPVNLKKIWLDAEKQIWHPWLSSKDGYLGRQIFLDEVREEALILVKWQNKEFWKSISMDEVELIQEKFEESVKSALNVNQNPFKLIYEGELVQQG